MKQLSFVVLVIVIATMQLAAQQQFRKNTVFGEIGGNGMILSLNFEHQTGTKPGLGWHAGIGLGGDNPAFPLGLTYLVNLGDSKSFLDAGAGINLLEKKMLEGKNTNADKNPYKAAYVPSLGYRHQTHYGLMWRINYSPVFSKYRSWPAYFGVAAGWRI